MVEGFSRPFPSVFIPSVRAIGPPPCGPRQRPVDTATKYQPPLVHPLPSSSFQIFHSLSSISLQIGGGVAAGRRRRPRPPFPPRRAPSSRRDFLGPWRRSEDVRNWWTRLPHLPIVEIYDGAATVSVEIQALELAAASSAEAGGSS
ncbi:unnamed protein product [Urochloa humidicola]